MADPRPVMRAYYISMNDEIGATATRPTLWFVVPTTQRGRWDAAVSTWHALSPRWPNGPKYYSVFAVNTADPPFVWDGRITAMDTQWNLGPTPTSYREPHGFAEPNRLTTVRAYFIDVKHPDGTYGPMYRFWFWTPRAAMVPTDAWVSSVVKPHESEWHVVGGTLDYAPAPNDEIDERTGWDFSYPGETRFWGGK